MALSVALSLATSAGRNEGCTRSKHVAAREPRRPVALALLAVMNGLRWLHNSNWETRRCALRNGHPARLACFRPAGWFARARCWAPCRDPAMPLVDGFFVSSAPGSCLARFGMVPRRHVRRRTISHRGADEPWSLASALPGIDRRIAPGGEHICANHGMRIPERWAGSTPSLPQQRHGSPQLAPQVAVHSKACG
jgi:hypothetical protein